MLYGIKYVIIVLQPHSRVHLPDCVQPFTTRKGYIFCQGPKQKNKTKQKRTLISENVWIGKRNAKPTFVLWEGHIAHMLS